MKSTIGMFLCSLGLIGGPLVHLINYDIIHSDTLLLLNHLIAVALYSIGLVLIANSDPDNTIALCRSLFIIGSIHLAVAIWYLAVLHRGSIALVYGAYGLTNIFCVSIIGKIAALELENRNPQ